MGAPFSVGAWLETLFHDLLTFMPFYAVMVGTAFLFAFPVALLVAAPKPGYRTVLLSASGGVGLAAAFCVADTATPVPTLIAATRHVPGFLAMASSGAVGGWVFSRWEPWPARIDSRVLVFLALISPALLLPGSYFFHRFMLPNRARPITDAAPFEYEVEVVSDGLTNPWGLVFLPDGRKLVSERAGNIRIIDASGALLEKPLKGVPESVESGHGGMLDIAISPNFTENRYLFFTYSCGTLSASNTCVGRGELHGHGLKNTRVLFQAQPLKPTNLQFGSRIAFLPDNTMLISVGDGFDYREESQNLEEHFGKILRLNMDGLPPVDNPFFGTGRRLDEIYSYGHRNPQGLFYDEASKRVYASDHGPYGGDEINIIEAGENYGWPVATYGVNYPGDYVSPYESLPGMKDPLYYWIPSIAPSGTIVYRGTDFPKLKGDLLVCALAGRGVFRIELENERVVRTERLFYELNKRIRLAKVGPDGRLYLLTDHDPGQILRIVPAGK
jgi:glucose/arabinose dehydrogenase